MASLRVRGEDGSIVERQVFSRRATLFSDIEDVADGVAVNETGNFNVELDPAVVQSVEYDHRGQTSSITSQCGETENRRASDELPDIAIEGVLVESQLDDAKQLKEGDRITLVSDLYQGPVFIKRLTITQDTDIIHYVPNGSNEEELAFSFQLQVGQPGGTAN